MSAVQNKLFPFLLVSTVLHLLLIFSWYGRALRPPAIETIPIEIFTAPEKAPPPPAVEKAAPRRSAAPPAAKAPRETARNEEATLAKSPFGQHAKIDRPGADVPRRATKKPEKGPETLQRPEETRAEKTPDVETAKDSDLAALSRREPTLRELLPPGFHLYTGETNDDPRSVTAADSRPVRLNTADPKSLPYYEQIRRQIDINWNYPLSALDRGLQGKAVIEFTISRDGQLESVRVIRSSGAQILDQEAVRAIMAAAPYKPIPAWMNARRLIIPVGFSYEDDRLIHEFVR